MDDEAEVKRNVSRVRFINWAHALLYFSCAFGGMMAAWEVVHWRQSNVFLLIGLGTTVLCLLLLAWWMWMDRNEDVLECPDWLRLLITLTGWGSLVLLLLGTLIQYL